MAAERARVVIIGAYGRIGLATGTLLAERGYDVVGLARGPRRSAPFPVLPLEPNEPGGLAAVFAGADAVLYCVGAHHGAVEHLHELEVFEVNAVSALRAALAAALAGCRRFVYLSSTSAVAVADGGAYVRSKWLAERLLTTAAPPGLTLLRLGWVLDPQDEVAHRQLWPESGRQVIVGDLPVPVVGLADVTAALELLVRPDLYPASGLSGRIDLVAGSPTQAELYAFVSGLSPLRVIDAGSPDRMVRLAALRRPASEPPTWLVQTAPEGRALWSAHGLTLRTWQECVRALWQAGWSSAAEDTRRSVHSGQT
jgi:nucleoside-diphosphate-sugar epimerase